MSKTIVVRVTDEHIKRGKRKNVTSCPIALALTDKGLRYPYVEDEQAFVYTDVDCTRSVRFPLSPRAQGFVMLFDRGGAAAVHPSTFRFTLP